jgi:hypothetical protein
MTSKTCNNVPYASMHFDGFCCHLSHPPPRQPKPQSCPQGALRSPPLVVKPNLGISPISSKYWCWRGPAFPPPCLIMHLVTPKPSFSANLTLQIRLAELRRATPPGLHSTPGYRPSVCCHSSHSPQASIVSGEKALPATQATPCSCK